LENGWLRIKEGGYGRAGLGEWDAVHENISNLGIKTFSYRSVGTPASHSISLLAEKRF